MRLEKVQLGYGATAVLHDVTLEIPQGDFVFVIGRSGAGKSTLLKTLMGHLRPQKGEVYANNGDNIYELPPRRVAEYRRKCGIVFQDFRLLTTKTVAENVAFSMEVCNYKHDYIAQKVPELLEKVGLTEKKDALPHELSGGEEQRAAIARALIHNPEVLLCDEPTGNLDPESADQILDMFLEFHASGKTIVFATHNKEIVNRLKKRVIRFEDGKIVSDKKQGKYE